MVGTDNTDADAWIALGTVGGPFQRPEGHQIANALEVAGRLYLFDVGNGVLRQLAKKGRGVDAVDAVFISHFHPDHMADLGLVIITRWLGRARTPLRVCGPIGITHLVRGIIDAYRPVVLASAHGEQRTTSLADSVVVVEIPSSPDSLTRVHDDGRVCVEAADVDHFRTSEPGSTDAPHAVGFRITTSTRRIAYTGDTGRSHGIGLIADGVDLLVTEVVDLEAVREHFAALDVPEEVRSRLLFNMEHNHISPKQIHEASVGARVRQTLLTHFVPAITEADRQTQIDRLTAPWGVEGSGEVFVAEDLAEY